MESTARMPTEQEIIDLSVNRTRNLLRAVEKAVNMLPEYPRQKNIDFEAMRKIHREITEIEDKYNQVVEADPKKQGLPKEYMEWLDNFQRGIFPPGNTHVMTEAADAVDAIRKRLVQMDIKPDMPVKDVVSRVMRELDKHMANKPPLPAASMGGRAIYLGR